MEGTQTLRTEHTKDLSHVLMLTWGLPLIPRRQRAAEVGMRPGNQPQSRFPSGVLHLHLHPPQSRLCPCAPPSSEPAPPLGSSLPTPPSSEPAPPPGSALPAPSLLSSVLSSPHQPLLLPLWPWVASHPSCSSFLLPPFPSPFLSHSSPFPPPLPFTPLHSLLPSPTPQLSSSSSSHVRHHRHLLEGAFPQKTFPSISFCLWSPVRACEPAIWLNTQIWPDSSEVAALRRFHQQECHLRDSRPQN